MVVFLLKRTCKWLQTCFRGTFKTFMLLFVPLARSLLMMRKTHIRVTQHRNCNKLVYLFSTFLFSLSLALSLSPHFICCSIFAIGWNLTMTRNINTSQNAFANDFFCASSCFSCLRFHYIRTPRIIYSGSKVHIGV